MATQTPSQKAAAERQAAIEREAGIAAVAPATPTTQRQVNAAERQAEIERQAGMTTTTVADQQAQAAKNAGLNPAPTVITSADATARNEKNQAELQAAQDNLQAAVSNPPPPVAPTTTPTASTTPSGTTSTTTNPTSTSTTTTGTTQPPSVDPLQAQIDAATSSIDGEYNETIGLLDARMASLNASTQAQVNAIKASFAVRREETKRLNQVLLQSNTKAGIRAGRDRYASEINSGILTAVEQDGIRRISELDAEELSLINEATAANDANQFNLLAMKMEQIHEKRKEKEAAISKLHEDAMKAEQAAFDRAKDLREMQKWDREDASTSIDAMVASGMDPTSVPEEYFVKLDAQAGYVPGTARGMMEVAAQEKSAQSEVDFINNMNSVIDLTSKLAPDQYLDFNGNRYYGTKSGNEFVGYEIDKGTGSITSIYRNDATGQLTYSTQDNVLEPNIDYEQQWIDNGNGTESLWYVSKDPNYAPVPVNPNVGGPSSGVNSGSIQEAFPQGASYTNGGAEAGLTEKDFWCLRWAANFDERGQELMNEVGNTLDEKRASVETNIGFGTGRPPQIGDYILTNEDPTWGHFAIINDIRTDPRTGKTVAVLSESNYVAGTVTHTRTVELDAANLESNGGSILGFKHSEFKSQYTSQPGGPELPLFTRPTEESKKSSEVSVAQQSSLRKEIANDTAISQYTDLNTTYQGMQAIADTALSKPTKESRAQLDQALITMFNKMLDPTSVVREGEYARTTQGQALLSQAQAKFEALKKGGAGINDATRREMVEVAKTLLGVAENQYKTSVDFYLPIIEDLGLDPSMFIKGYGSVSSESDQLQQLIESNPLYASEIQSAIDEGYTLDEIMEALQ